MIQPQQLPTPNVVFLGFRFFKANFKILGSLMLINLTLQYLFNWFGALFDLKVNAVAFANLLNGDLNSGTDLMPVLLSLLSVSKIIFLLVYTAFTIFLNVVFLIALRLIQNFVCEKQQVSSLEECRDLSYPISINEFLVNFRDFYFSNITFKLTLYVIFVSILVPLVCFIIGTPFILIYPNTIIFAIFLFFTTFVPGVITNLLMVLIVWQKLSLKEHIRQIAYIFKHLGGQFFNYFIFIILIGVILGAAVLFITAFVNTIFTLIGLEAIGTFLAGIIAPFITGASSYFILIVASMLVASYFSHKNKNQ